MPRPTTPRRLGPRSPRAEAAQRLLTQRLTDARQAREKLGRTLEPEAVHDLRVATRRLRAALKVFRPLGSLKSLEDAVKHLQDALGQVRDIHVQADWLTRSAQERKPARREGLEALRSSVESHLGARERHLRRALEQWTKRTVPALQRDAQRLEGQGRYGDKESRKPLLHRLRQMKRHMKEYVNAPHPLLAHQLRKSVKKLRYEAELFHPARPDDMDEFLEELEPLQEVLGDLHDADVRMELLARFMSEGTVTQRNAARKLMTQVSEERAKHAARIDHELHRWRARNRFQQLRRLLK